jgi:hypothetical protein
MYHAVYLTWCSPALPGLRVTMYSIMLDGLHSRLSRETPGQLYSKKLLPQPLFSYVCLTLRLPSYPYVFLPLRLPPSTSSSLYVFLPLRGYTRSGLHMQHEAPPPTLPPLRLSPSTSSSLYVFLPLRLPPSMSSPLYVFLPLRLPLPTSSFPLRLSPSSSSYSYVFRGCNHVSWFLQHFLLICFVSLWYFNILDWFGSFRFDFLTLWTNLVRFASIFKHFELMWFVPLRILNILD